MLSSMLIISCVRCYRSNSGNTSDSNM